MYGLRNRDKVIEMEARYNGMVCELSAMFDCGIWDIECLFDSRNHIDVAFIVKEHVNEFGSLPTWNQIYRQAFYDFVSEHDLVAGKDVDIYLNYCLDTHIYVREDLDKQIVEEFEYLFGMDAELM